MNEGAHSPLWSEPKRNAPTPQDCLRGSLGDSDRRIAGSDASGTPRGSRRGKPMTRKRLGRGYSGLSWCSRYAHTAAPGGPGSKLPRGLRLGTVGASEVRRRARDPAKSRHSGTAPCDEPNCDMPTLPWVETDTAWDEDVLVMATRLDLASLGPVLGFFRASMAIRRQARTCPGALGISLVAHPMQKRFLTLSAWTSREALDRFVAAPPHRDAMKRYRPKMNHPVFVTWSMPASRLPPTWSEATERLEHDPHRTVK